MQPVSTKQEPIDYSGELTAEEIAGERLTPEILWKFGRITDDQLSPDRLYGCVLHITRYNAKTNGKITDIATVPSNGGEMKNPYPFRWRLL